MTTLIYSCGNPETAFTAQQLTYLANTYQETSYTTDWQPGEQLPDMLIVSDIDRETAQSLDLAEEDIVDYYDAIKLLTQASDDKMRADKPQCDIIMPAGLMPAGHIPPQQRNDTMTVTDAIDLAAMLIDNDLCDNSIPEHTKADLRVLKRLIDAIQANHPFTTDTSADRTKRQENCIKALRSIIIDITNIKIDVVHNKFHNARTAAEEEAEL